MAGRAVPLCVRLSWVRCRGAYYAPAGGRRPPLRRGCACRARALPLPQPPNTLSFPKAPSLRELAPPQAVAEGVKQRFTQPFFIETPPVTAPPRHPPPGGGLFPEPMAWCAVGARIARPRADNVRPYIRCARRARALPLPFSAFALVGESPSQRLTPLPAPLVKGGLWSRTGAFKHPSPPCQRGEGRRVKPGGGGIPSNETAQRNPPITAFGGASHPGRGKISRRKGGPCTRCRRSCSTTPPEGPAPTHPRTGRWTGCAPPTCCPSR